MPGLPDADARGAGDDPVDEFKEENDDPVYLKYMFDGAASIAELSAELRLADQLDKQSAGGWRLAEPVASGWAHLTREAEA
jgi:hypothetical protein